MKDLQNLIQIAVNLNATLTSKDRYHELLRIFREIVPYDAAVLMILEKDQLIPLASFGLISEATEKAYTLKEHPRLDIIANAKSPIRFPLDCDLPDPFDGMVEDDPKALEHVHACMGCPLIVEDKTIGILTADSLRPHAFDEISDDFLHAIAALSGATLRTSRLLDTFEESARIQGMLAQDLMEQVSSRGGGELIGTGTQITRLKENIKLVAKSDLAVLVMGETGTGKELVARGIHAYSRRSDKPLIYVNCAALPESIAESELFGHRKGSFTGAIQDRMGKFEVANNGTLFLDEIGELPLSIQAKLLRAIQEGEIQRVGDDRPRKVDVRVIAATNRDLVEEIKKGTFRSDLYHRLNVYPLVTPPLRDHLHDIPLLTGFFCDTYQRRLGSKPFRLSEASINKLSNYEWPGNVRELKNIISRATLHASQENTAKNKSVILIEPKHLFLPSMNEGVSAIDVILTAQSDHHPTLQEALTLYKKEIILEAVKRHEGNWAGAAKELGLHRSNLYHLRDQLGLKYP
ncbi:MAG: nitric oxide reductase transcriptional regulator NorR [Bacteriovoracaceae bacterium]|nr:nitric oxide reductase transcriptional regulator NorR [Bacteriovoracaceae bacterium]